MLNRWTLLPLLMATQIRAKITNGPTQLDQGFFFDHIVPGQTWIIPTVEQCSTIPLKWDRGVATGPSPLAPYSLQVYTSAFTTPFLVDAGEGTSLDWPVPFDNGTLFQVCMFASNGVTGGCFESFTVNPGTDGCQNVTLPTRLGVKATISETKTQIAGNLSQSGWVEECSDIQLQPTDGQPPYVMTIAPTLAPPINLTSDNNDMISWTVNLGRSLPFYISLASSDGKMWSYGPLHVGAGTTDCLGIDPTPSPSPSPGPVLSSSGMISESKAIGASVGSLVAGLVIGAIGALLFTWLRNRKNRQETEDADQRVHAFTSQIGADSSAHLPKPSETSSPLSHTDILSPLRYTEPASGLSGAGSASSATVPFVTETTTVVRRHHDGGFRYPAPEAERQVVELPPEYMSESGGDTAGDSSNATQRLRGGGSSEGDTEEDSRTLRARWISPFGNSSSRNEKTG